jgi:hypothetical protein
LNFLQTSLKLLQTFMSLSQNSYERTKTQNSYKILTKFLQNSYKILTKFLQNSYKILTKFVQNSYKIRTKFVQNSYKTYSLQILFWWLIKFLTNILHSFSGKHWPSQLKRHSKASNCLKNILRFFCKKTFKFIAIKIATR